MAPRPSPVLPSYERGTGWLAQSVRQASRQGARRAREQGWLQEWAKTGAAARCRHGSARARLRNRRLVHRRGPHPTTASRANPTPRADPVVHAQATGRTDPTRPADPAAGAKATGRTDPTHPAEPLTQAEATRGADPPLAPHPAAPAQPTTRTDLAQVKATRRVDPTQAAGPAVRAQASRRAEATRRTELAQGADPVPLAQTGRDDLTQRTGPTAQAKATRRAHLGARAQATGRGDPTRLADPTGLAGRGPRCSPPAPICSPQPTSRRSDSCRHRRARSHCRCCAASPQGRDPARAHLVRQHHRARQSTGQPRLARTACPFRLGCQGVRRALRSCSSRPLRDLRCLPAGLPPGPVRGRCRRASRSGSPGSGETARSGRSRCLPLRSGCLPVPWSLGC